MKPFKFLSAEILENVEGYISGSKIADGRGYDQPITSEGDCTFFSCDHVVSKDNVEMYSVGRDAGGRGFDFRMKGRNREETIDGLGGVVLDGCRGCGRGTVLFSGSYKYEEVVVRRWRKTGLMERLKGAVKVYREPREARDLEAVLRNFSRDASTGALLICVIGGKMSEGINFSNDMARLIIVAGLPYPDVTDEELKTKMKHLDEKKDGITGNEYYFNLCMRAVNQSIGRGEVCVRGCGVWGGCGGCGVCGVCGGYAFLRFSASISALDTTSLPTLPSCLLFLFLTLLNCNIFRSFRETLSS